MVQLVQKVGREDAYTLFEVVASKRDRLSEL
jgi:hypothetical protein